MFEIYSKQTQKHTPIFHDAFLKLCTPFNVLKFDKNLMGRQLDRAPAYIGNLPVCYVRRLVKQWRIGNLP
jgi:hypothetical protein